MNDKSPTKISRRDAMKILAVATGATALANIPSKWVKPGLDIGVLPAHAQTSGGHTVTAGISDPAASFCNSFTSTAVIAPPTPGILLHYVIALSNGSTLLTSPAALTGTMSTDPSGMATLTITVDTSSTFNAGDTITVTWSFENPSDGTGSSSQVFTSFGSGC